MKEHILIVDDQIAFCHHVQAILESEGYQVAVAHNADKALGILSDQTFGVALLDMNLPGMNGLQLFNQARKIDPDISGIIMTAYGSISSAVASIKLGISDYIQKPFEPDVLLMVLGKTFRERMILKENRDLRRELDQRYSFGNIIGKNYKMQAIYELIQRVAPTDSRVFITGETGTGKELVAKAIHFNSPRKNKPFVGINCGALVENLLESELFGHEIGAFTGAVRARSGKFEYARGGTIFLDEVGDISPGMQVKLLRVLQEGKLERVGGNQSIEVDVRVISATNQDLQEKIRNHGFRIELFYRLNVVPIHIPPLRERREDLPLLLKHFIGNFNQRFNKNIQKISQQVMSQLMAYDWPGNVRELENVLERAFVTADGEVIDQVIFISKGANSRPSELEYLDTDIPFDVAKSTIIRRFEKAYLYESLKKNKGNVSTTAKNSGINPRTLWRKIKEYGIKTDHLLRPPEEESDVTM